MTTAPDRQFISRPQRFSVEDIQNLKVTFKRKTTADRRYDADLLDFSRQGMKLRTAECLKFEELVHVHIDFSENGLYYEGTAQVRHIRPEKKVDSFQVGCSLTPHLADELIEFLAKKSGKERRKHSRSQKVGEGTLFRQGSTEGHDTVVKNISRGGFGVVIDCPLEVGESAKLVIEDLDGNTQRIETRVCWILKDGEFYKAGFSFTDDDAYGKLSKCLKEDKVVPKPISESTGVNDDSNWFIFAAALFVMVAPSALLMSNVFATKTEANTVASSANVQERDSDDSASLFNNLHKSQPMVAVAKPESKTKKRVAPQANVVPRTTVSSIAKPKQLKKTHTPNKSVPKTSTADTEPGVAIHTKPNRIADNKKVTQPEIPALNKNESKAPLDIQRGQSTANKNRAAVEPKAKAVLLTEIAPATNKQEAPIAKQPRVIESPNLVYPEPSFDPTMIREWKDITGQFTVMASLGKVTKEFVVLRKSDGGTIRVPYGKLCKEDLEFILKAGDNFQAVVQDPNVQ